MFLAVACLAPSAGAAGVTEGLDPFDTDALVPRGLVPCAPAAATTATNATMATAALTLLDVVDGALCANPQTREVWANARAQAAQVGVAEAAYLPSLSASAGTGRSRTNGAGADTRSLGASLSWLIYDFGGRAATLENARQLLEAANATQDATVQAVFLAAVQAYYQVQAGEAALAAARESEKASTESFNAAEARYKVGAATPADKLQAQTALSQAILNRITAEGSLKAAQGSLAAVLGRDAHRAPALAAAPQLDPPSRFDQNVESLIEEARRRRPDLRAAEAQARAASAGLDVAKAAGRPSLSLGLSANDSHVSGLPESRTGTVGVTLSVPLFSGFATNYRIRAAEAQMESKQAAAERTRLQVAQEVWNAYQSLVTASQSVRTTADLLASADQSHQVNLGRYKAGVGSILDLLNAQSALASARQQRVQALFSWNVARVALAQAMGTLDRGLLETLQESRTP